MRGWLAVWVGLVTVAAADPFMGDWQGVRRCADGTTTGVVAQVLAGPGTRYSVNLHTAFACREAPLAVLAGSAADGKVALVAAPGSAFQGWSGELTPERLSGRAGDAAGGTFELQPVIRLSPTLGAPPPAGAVVLFDGAKLDAWTQPGGQPCGWRVADGGALEVVPGKGALLSRQKFGDCRVHVEFRVPFLREQSGQGRGNSGVYLQGRYEVQVLDSYGLEGAHNECGGIYSVAAPRANLCAPPRQWQTYDIVFKAPRFDAGGKKTASARLTVRHNGVLVHDGVEVPHPTAAAMAGNEVPVDGLYLQDHGNPVQFRNIWVVAE